MYSINLMQRSMILDRTYFRKVGFSMIDELDQEYLMICQLADDTI